MSAPLARPMLRPVRARPLPTCSLLSKVTANSPPMMPPHSAPLLMSAASPASSCRRGASTALLAAPTTTPSRPAVPSRPASGAITLVSRAASTPPTIDEVMMSELVPADRSSGMP